MTFYWHHEPNSVDRYVCRKMYPRSGHITLTVNPWILQEEKSYKVTYRDGVCDFHQAVIREFTEELVKKALAEMYGYSSIELHEESPQQFLRGYYSRW